MVTRKVKIKGAETWTEINKLKLGELEADYWNTPGRVCAVLDYKLPQTVRELTVMEVTKLTECMDMLVENCMIGND